MAREIHRRSFLEAGAAAACGLMVAGAQEEHRPQEKPVRTGVIGTGNRGRGLLGTLLEVGGAEVPALCDVDEGRLRAAQDQVEKAGRKRPEAYGRGERDFERLLARDDLDAVIIATPWHWHAPMAVTAMLAGKRPAVEVPAAIDMRGCWDLVDVSEKTGVPCMMLENWSFRRDNLAVLNMIRGGLLGEIVHCHCAHSHNCVDHWFFDEKGEMRWSGEYLVQRNADQYPTHSLGPVLSWMDINCGDAFATLTSTATRSLGINRHLEKVLGPEHPSARRRYAQGDIVTTVVKTHKGNTIVINYDMQLPRPYDNRWMVQGTLGLYDEGKSAVYLHGRSPKYQEWEPFAPYQERHDHAWWKALPEKVRSGGHGGTDHLELALFLKAVRNGAPPPIDVYDSVAMSAIVPLSEQSIAAGSAPVECPDFTRGKWKARKPSFAVES